MALETQMSHYRDVLEEDMRTVVHEGRRGERDLFQMLRYHLGWIDAAFEPCAARSGKLVRPTLCLLWCNGCGGDWTRAVPAATAIELLHNFSLIHDDIEDRDEMRRGRPTLWSIWGEAQAINGGDTLFALAQLALLRLEERGVAPMVVLDAVRLFNETSVALTVGQHLDIGFEQDDAVSAEEYLAMIEGKTAALVACACELGALVAGASTAQRGHVHSFGLHLGLAFQLVDDVLGIWGDEAVTGKPVGADIRRRKKTLPMIYGLEQGGELRRLMSRERISDAEVGRVRYLLEDVGSREYTEELARVHHEAALDALAQADLSGAAAAALGELSGKLLKRRR